MQEIYQVLKSELIQEDGFSQGCEEPTSVKNPDNNGGTAAAAAGPDEPGANPLRGKGWAGGDHS